MKIVLCFENHFLSIRFYFSLTTQGKDRENAWDKLTDQERKIKKEMSFKGGLFSHCSWRAAVRIRAGPINM